MSAHALGCWVRTVVSREPESSTAGSLPQRIADNEQACISVGHCSARAAKRQTAHPAGDDDAQDSCHTFTFSRSGNHVHANMGTRSFLHSHVSWAVFSGAESKTGPLKVPLLRTRKRCKRGPLILASLASFPGSPRPVLRMEPIFFPAGSVKCHMGIGYERQHLAVHKTSLLVAGPGLKMGEHRTDIQQIVYCRCCEICQLLDCTCMRD